MFRYNETAFYCFKKRRELASIVLKIKKEQKTLNHVNCIINRRDLY